MPHHPPQQTDKKLGRQPTFVGAVPEPTPGIHRRCRADRLPLPRTRHHRGLSFDAPSPAMHGIGTEPRLVPEEDLTAFHFGLSCNGRIAHALPALDRLRVALKRLLRRQIEAGEQLADRREAQADIKLPLNQRSHHRSCPQPEVQTILSRVLAVDPAEHLLLLPRRQTPWAPRCRPRFQRTQPDTRLGCRGKPLIDGGAVEPVGCDDHRSCLALPHPLDCHQSDGLQGSVVERSSILLHTTLNRASDAMSTVLSPYLPTGE